MKKSLILLSALGLSLCSCTTITHTGNTEGIDTEIYNLTVADLKVAKERETVTTEWKWNPFSPQSLKSQKESAQHELLEKSSADVLVDPQFSVTRRGLFRGGSLTVTGYPAKYSNFRNMSKEDAENIAIINGTLSTVVVNPVVATSNGQVISRPKPIKKRSEEAEHRSFVDISYGPQYDIAENLDTGAQFAIMYGSYGKKWGWYAKLALASASGYNPYRNEDESTTTAYVTGGFIRTISSHWNFMAGLGIGGHNTTEWTNDEYYRYYDKPVSKFSIPVEFAFQWTNRRINLMLGLNYATPLGGEGSGTMTPSIGIGYNF